MTTRDSGPRQPGTTLLKVARVVFSARVFETVVAPTIADLRREVADAGPDRAGRARALWRGYRAFWTLVLLGPFVSWDAVTGHATRRSNGDLYLEVPFVLLAVVAVAASVAVMGIWSAGLAVASALVALLVHRWYRRHPSRVATLTEPAPVGARRHGPAIPRTSSPGPPPPMN
ncbi:MAG: hypothetical protein KGN76_07195 [Acidobacteriota bacterium]|nr:hypothetical protein [Acidobacteriota bacterium]